MVLLSVLTFASSSPGLRLQFPLFTSDQEDRELAKISVADIFVPINGGFGRRGLGQKRFTSGNQVIKCHGYISYLSNPQVLFSINVPLPRHSAGDPTQDLVNVYKLYSLLTAALSPMFLVGEVQPLDDNKGQKKVGLYCLLKMFS